MKGQYLLPICAQTGFLAKLALEKPIELAEAQDVYAWVSYTPKLTIMYFRDKSTNFFLIYQICQLKIFLIQKSVSK